MDQRDMQPVVRHLVDEERLRLMPMALHQLQILLAVSVQLVRRKRSEPRVIIVRPASNLPSNEGNVGKLLRSLDRRMARQDLLDERRSRTGHADDEDRV